MPNDTAARNLLVRFSLRVAESTCSQKVSTDNSRNGDSEKIEQCI